MKQQLLENRWFYIPFILFVIGLSIVVGLYHSKDVVLFLNGMDHFGLQSFFYLITLMGEWVGGVIVACILLWSKPLKYTLVFLIAIGLASGTSGLLKETVFHDIK
ncbi:hypothetical protein GYB22_02095, partial [bacterium]|nr:hypothetical protein [bacterium]